MNAYFQIINGDDNTSIKLVPATDNGNAIDMSELINYLNYHKILFPLTDLNKAVLHLHEETIIKLNDDVILPIREEFSTEIKEDNMKAVGRFYSPSSKGSLMTKDEIIGDLKHRGIVYGICEDKIDKQMQNREYMTDIVLAVGTQPVQGKDASIEYFFNTNLKSRPTLLDDGSVDFFHLNIVNHCDKGELLARLHREEVGEFGSDIMGTKIKPHDVKRLVLKFGRNIMVSDDKTEIFATENGHVTLVDDRVFVSNLMEIENVDPSTGDVEYEGNVQINGNVCSNFKVHAKGNVEVRGVVEGAKIIAGGNITIARGMNGMGKGMLKADGNIVARFIENASIEATGYVEAGSILHSNVFAGTEIHVNGKRGFISGGHVCATTLVDVKILGSDMGTDTVVEIGTGPSLKKRFKELSDLTTADNKVMARAIPILEAARSKYEAGKQLTEDQIANIRELALVVKEKRIELAQYAREMGELKELIDVERPAQVVVHDTVYPGTKIVISDVSKIIKESMKYCRFIKSEGDVRMIGM